MKLGLVFALVAIVGCGSKQEVVRARTVDPGPLSVDIENSCIETCQQAGGSLVILGCTPNRTDVASNMVLVVIYKGDWKRIRAKHPQVMAEEGCVDVGDPPAEETPARHSLSL